MYYLGLDTPARWEYIVFRLEDENAPAILVEIAKSINEATKMFIPETGNYKDRDWFNLYWSGRAASMSLMELAKDFTFCKIECVNCGLTVVIGRCRREGSLYSIFVKMLGDFLSILDH